MPSQIQTVPYHVETQVLVVGAGGAGMYAALSAAREGAAVLLTDRNVVGRGGATIMAQMTVAAALGEQEPDAWELHYEDTLSAGRGLCDPELAALLCRDAPARIREMDEWKVGWARDKAGNVSQVKAPGHSRKRCCYVDVLNTGPAVAATLRRQVSRVDAIRRVSNLVITDVVVHEGEAIGAAGFDLETGTPVTIAAQAVIIATGGLTRLYQRNSASCNMAGEGYSLALRAGAELLDMEFVQFFPIGHLAPRMVGMDPIMWDPFRYKLGGRLLNGNREEFINRYGGEDDGTYSATRDLATHAIFKEVEAGRGSPHGGAWLDFSHLPEQDLRDAFGPVIDRLRENGINLMSEAVEVAPIAHYHMGGIRVDTKMATAVPGLYAAGEAVGGANGANRLSGNAIPEAFVFGDVAGRTAARRASGKSWVDSAAKPALDALRERSAMAPGDGPAPSAILGSLQELMWAKVGPFRTEPKLTEALATIRDWRRDPLQRAGSAGEAGCHTALAEWYQVRAGLDIAEVIAEAALCRRESRGAHQRDDCPDMDAANPANSLATWKDGTLKVGARPVVQHANAGRAA